MLQRYGDKFKYRCCPDSLKRLTSVKVKPEHMHIFEARADKVFHSELFDDIQTGAESLIAFIEKVTGVRCSLS